MKKRILLNSLAAACVVITTGCGVVKSREDRVVTALQAPGSEQAGSVSSAGGPGSEDEELRQIKQFLDLYTDHGAVTREGLANFLEKYKDKIAPFLAGLNLSSQDLVDMVFAFDANHDGRVTPQEIADGLKKRIPILRWIPDNTAEITRDELARQIALEYPKASAPGVAGLADTLMRFDQSWAGGNANGKVGRAELSTAGLIIGVLAQTDFSNGFTIPPGSIPPLSGGQAGGCVDLTPVAAKLIQQKVDQQLLGRYAAHASSELSQDDQRLEWMQVVLKFVLSDLLVHHYGEANGPHSGELSESTAQTAFSAWGIPQQPHWSQLRAIYDNPMMGGDGDGYYSSIETFNYLTDLEFAQKLLALTHGDFSAASLGANPAKHDLLARLLKLMPRTGEALFMDDLDPAAMAKWGLRKEYWDSFTQFDDPFLGGDGNGTLDIGETAMGMVYAKLIENLYELFDTNHNTYLERSEGDHLFAVIGAQAGITFNYRAIDAFYANIGLNTASPGLFARLRIFFSHGHTPTSLRPYDFQVRLVQILPRMLDKSEQDTTATGGCGP